MQNDTSDIPSLVRDSSIHSALYTDESIFEREMDTIFRNGWVFVAHESELTERGSFLRRTMGLEQVLVVRARDGSVSVMANRCTHRGNLLCQERAGRKTTFACQYHGWVFSLGGDLIDVPFPVGFPKERSAFDLRKAKVASYGGFIFATFAEAPIALEEHLGPGGRRVIDRCVRLSPVGEIDLTGGWVRHEFYSNWKMLVENNTDGYHVNFVHDSFARGIKVQYKYDNVLVSNEAKLEAVVRDLGNGHAEIDYAPTYRKPLVWLGTEPDRYPEYTRLMHEAYGQAAADEALREGPPHSYIFPNLFIAETAVTMIQPLSVDKCVNWHTPLYYKGVPREVNERILRQGEVALGPSAFLLADDAIISERQWRALKSTPLWLDLTRGLEREQAREDGTIVSHYSDETPNRGFWGFYKELFANGAAKEVAHV